MTAVDDSDAAAAIAGLPGMTPARLRRLLAAGEPAHVAAAIAMGSTVAPGIDPFHWATWRVTMPRLLVEMPERCRRAGVTVSTRGDESYPLPLRGDPAAPAVLFVRGDVSALSHRRVGIVGTRSATRAGRAFARDLGARLADAGVSVVSGLARGIDVESHDGALGACGAPPVAVVASGCDVVYPREHAAIWERVCATGAVVSEVPPGTRPVAAGFPRRNRILAALSEVLVVVESRATGGSMITVAEAAKRDVCVMAVPGFPGAPASEGTNALIADGCAPVTGVDDVLTALGLDTRRVAGWFDARRRPTVDEADLLAVFDRRPRTVDELALATGATVLDVAVMLGRLETAGWVASSDGWWEALPAAR